MATSSRRARPARTLATLGILLAALFGTLIAGTQLSDASLTPGLALDLEGGTQIILTPVTQDDTEVTEDTIAQAIEIIRQRVDASGVAEAEITSQGEGNIVVALPGEPSPETLRLVRESAQMLFRPVLAVAAPQPSAATEQPPVGGEGPIEPPAVVEGPPEGEAPAEGEAPVDGEAPVEGEAPAEGQAPAEGDAAGPEPLLDAGTVELVAHAGAGAARAETEPAPAEPAPAGTAPAETAPPTEPANASDPAWLTDELLQEFQNRDCTDPANLTGGADLVGPLDAAVVSCDASGTAKYVLGPVEVRGEDVDTASSGLRVTQTGAVTNEWVVNLGFDGEGTEAFRDVTTRLLSLEPPRNQFAMVLDGLVISAPAVNSPITDGNAEISGSFDRDSAATLARQLNFGALPLTFQVESEQQISASLGGEQLQKGLLAGVIGLVLVAAYSLFQYRALGLVTIASLLVAGLLTYGLIALLSWTQGYRLSLPGVAGLIVAIGITVDSFIVYFERIRDELRDGRTLVAAVEEGWRRARQTILASDAVSFLAAVVLYFLAVGGVRGFAFTLGLTTLVDLVVVFMFTHPLMALLARTKFFGKGHPLSGLDPRLLEAKARYMGRGKVVPAARGTGRAPSQPAESDVEPREAGVPEPAGVGAGRMTIAERRAAERRAAAGHTGATALGSSGTSSSGTDNDRKDA